MNAPEGFLEKLEAKTVKIQLNGKAVKAKENETILKVARREGIDIPTLCYKDDYREDGNCRACVVEVKGERVLAPSCCRNVAEGMEINTNNERATLSQKMILEMLLADLPETGHKWVSDDKNHPHGELSLWAKKLGVEPRSELKAIRREKVEQDVSHTAMFVDLSFCIQ